MVSGVWKVSTRVPYRVEMAAPIVYPEVAASKRRHEYWSRR